MKTINVIRYSGSNHTTLVADTKNNPEMGTSIQATALSAEEAEINLKTRIGEQLSEGDNIITPEDLELVVTDFTKFSSFDTQRLLKMYDKTEEMLGAHEMIEAILIKRGAMTINDDPEEEPAETEEETPKPQREYKKCMTEECLQARLAEARKNYKKFARFLCTKTKTEEYGIIRSARLDKRSGFIQYRIEIITLYKDNKYSKTGRIYGKGDDSKDLVILTDKEQSFEEVIVVAA